MQEQNRPFRTLTCLLLGEEPLAQRCAEVLLERGHKIVALVTNTPALDVWFRDNGIPTLKRSEYAARIASFDFDVLLSITHPALIAPAIIERAKVAAINYHDGPLPRYAGMNGSAWALHNGETVHAIVWHHLTSGLDEGDVLERRDTTFEPRETSLSLNMKNSALALESFHEVVVRLETGNLTGTPQRKDVERSVFSRHDRPRALTVLDWIQSAHQIDHVIRACAFGQFPNRFGAAKVVHRERAVIVREADVIAEADSQAAPNPSNYRPGTVVSIDDEHIVVACNPGTIRLNAFATLTGAPLTPRQAAAELRVSAGEVFAEPGRDEWVAATRKVAEHEPEFIRRLQRREVPQLPFAPGGGFPAAVPLSLPPEFTTAYESDVATAASALFLFTLSCLLREDNFTIAVTDAAHQRGVLATVCSPALPCDVTIPQAAPFQSFVEQVARENAKVLATPGFLLDLISRDPALRDQADLVSRAISSVAVVLGQAGLPHGAKLGLVASEYGCALLSDGSFSPKELSSLAVRMANLALRLATADKDVHLSKVDCLSAQERSQQLFDWNATARPFPEALRIFDLFEQQVDLQPNATALVFNGQTMTFIELERRANQVANTLRGLGVGNGEYVGLIVERSFELVIALLGISKSGAAYVPVDTIYPADRTEFILEDTRCRVCVVSPEFTQRAGARTAVVTNSPELLSASTERLPCGASALDVCYTIFTSGSTGKPKGVVLTHKAVINTLDWVNRTFKVTPSDRLLFVTSPSFDLSVYDVFGALGAGASVEVASRELLAEPEKLVEHICHGGITIWDSAPPALARLAPFFPSVVPNAKLRLAMLSGDWIPVTLPDHLMRVFPGIKVKSLGGATEAAIWSNFHHVDYVDPTWTSIPYGRPIQNARYYILDHHQRPIPAGLTGDLYIGGTCLALGYLNRAELTADRFIPDPYVSGERIYKTGDLARFWSDGTMEFQGRADFQVKIRGFRVEIGEVEAALCAQPGVRTALCSAHQDASGQKALVAYVQPKSNHVLDEDELKRALSVNLPDFMVPTFILFLDSFPLSANGKIDRKALPTPDQKKTKTPYAPPATALQRQLVQLWQTVMKRDQIGIDDNFFELGGHSLMAVSLVTAIRSQLGLELTLSKVLERPTIRTLAAAYDNKSATATPTEQDDVTVVDLRSGGSKSFFFIYDGEGETLLYLNLAKRLPEDFHVYGILPRTKPGVPMAHRSIEEMAAFAIKQMKTFQPEGPYYIGGLCAGGVVSFEMAVQLERTGDSVNSVVLLEAFEPHANPRRGLTTQRRIDRFKRVFANGEPASFASLLKARSAMLKVAATKVANAAGYEVSSRIGEATIAAKLRLLERTLMNDQEWPMWVTPLNTRDIYIAARSKYTASRITCKNVILVKATEVVPGVRDDEPARDSYVEPLLGWEPYVPNGIQVLDVSGGHSSMLQEPYVEDLSVKLRPLLA